MSVEMAVECLAGGMILGFILGHILTKRWGL
jgi:hypothetical protein